MENTAAVSMGKTKLDGLEEAVLKLVHTFCAPPEQVVDMFMEDDGKGVITYTVRFENGCSNQITCKTEKIGQCTVIKSINFDKG